MGRNAGLSGTNLDALTDTFSCFPCLLLFFFFFSYVANLKSRRLLPSSVVVPKYSLFSFGVIAFHVVSRRLLMVR